MYILSDRPKIKIIDETTVKSLIIRSVDNGALTRDLLLEGA